MDRISVIIPTHNRSNLLQRAIYSVQKQTMPVDEIIVVSDGSTDNTEELVLNMAKSDERIKLIAYHPGHNGNYARNKGLEVATGNYIAFLDDDDEWLPEKTKLEMDVLKKNDDVGLVYSSQYCIYEELGLKYPTKPYFKGDLSKQAFIGPDIGTPSQVMVKREVLDKTGFFDLNLGALQDLDLWIRCCQVTKIDYVSVPCINYYNSVNTNQVSSNTEKYIKSVKYIREKYDSDIRNYGDEFARTVDALNEAKTAWRCLRNRQIKEARRHAVASLKIKINKKSFIVIIASFFPYELLLKIRCKYRLKITKQKEEK